METFKGKRVLVTGGAGFIGSHIVDRLLSEGASVLVYDNLSTGRMDYLQESTPKPEIIVADILDRPKLTAALKGCDFVFHLAANADVRGGIQNTQIDLEQNILGTHSVLESMKANNIKGLAFSSSATVYGEPAHFPTSETEPLIQTSLYGASKLAGESLIQAYAEYFGWKTYSFRFVSWIGERYSHGVIFDFMKKLRKNASELEILGNGQQKKSYLYVGDGVEGIFHAIKFAKGSKNIFNLGHSDFMPVTELATIILNELKLSNVKFKFTGGERGWIGDSPLVHLDTSAMQDLGWKAVTPIEEGIRRTVRYLQQHPEVLERK